MGILFFFAHAHRDIAASCRSPRHKGTRSARKFANMNYSTIGESSERQKCLPDKALSSIPSHAFRITPVLKPSHVSSRAIR